MKSTIIRFMLITCVFFDVKSMSVSLRSEVEGTKIRRIVGTHSSIDNVFSFCGKPLTNKPICKINYSVAPSDKKGDGVIIDVNDEELRLVWDYEDRFDYAPRPCGSNGKYVIVREDKHGKTLFRFVIVPQKKAEEIASRLIQDGEQDNVIIQQVGLFQEKVQKLRQKQM
jgi:hypothetical protein